MSRSDTADPVTRPQQAPAAADRPANGTGLSGAQVLASTLASVSSALALSVLGAAGTILGAALGAVVATVGTALYSQFLHRTSTRLRTARGARPRRLRVRWKPAVAASLAVFVLAVAGITAVELATGRSVSKGSGKTRAPSVAQIVGKKSSGSSERDKTSGTRGRASATPRPSATTSRTSSSSPTATNTPSGSVPRTPTPTRTPTRTPTGKPTTSTTPSGTGAPETERRPETAVAE